MQAKIRVSYLGIDEFTGTKDPSKVYHNVNLLQGNEVIKSFLSDGQEVLFKDFKKLDELECEVNARAKQNKYGVNLEVKILSVLPLDEHGNPVLKQVKQSA